MKDKIKVLGVLLLAGFSFFYTNKVSNIIRDNDPIMNQINEIKNDRVVSKIDPIIMNDEYIPGINGCKVDEKESYNKMKNVGSFKEELIVMKEDKVEDNSNLYIINGNKEKRSISIILLDINDELDQYIKNNNIKINYFLDGEYITDNIKKIIEISKYSKIYSYGRNTNYLNKYIVYDNSIIETNLNNKSNYCLFLEKNKKQLDLCTSYKMKSIKQSIIKNDILSYTKENLSNGKIFVFDKNSIKEIKITINYILSKGYKIEYLDDLLKETNNCL